MDPAGNTTVIILDPVPRERYASLALELMENKNLCAEQVGYLETAEDPCALARLHMMGGEFCGNAARSFAAFLAFGGLKYVHEGEEGRMFLGFDEKEKEITIKISGHNVPLTAKVKNIGELAACDVEIAMPLPIEIRHGESESLGPYSLVIFEGIVHLVLWEKQADARFIGLAEKLIKAEGQNTECFGVLFYDKKSGRMTPVVSVSSVGSVVWESSCGSGSIAVASALADIEKKSIEKRELLQPGGSLFVSADRKQDGTLAKALLSGKIAVIAAGKVYL